MTKYYSASTGGFYDSRFNSTLPDDVVALTDQAYETLLSAQTSGQQIINSSGQPVAQPYVVNASVVLKAAAIKALNNTDVVASRCYKSGITYPTAWQSYTESLRNIVNGTDTVSVSLPAMPAYPANT